MKAKHFSRWQASGLHLLISIAIAAAVLTAMLLVWYPHPLFEAAGGNDLLLILVGVDVIIGPLITLVIFKPGKWGLKFDLWVIGVLQVAALFYGGYIMFLARPAFIVFVKDRFEVVTPAELESENLAQARRPEFRKPPPDGPMRVAADMPTDREERNKMVAAALSGLDLQHFPRYWVPYDQRRGEVLKNAQTLQELRRKEPAWAKVVDEHLPKWGIKESEVLFVPLRARRAWVGVLIDPKTAEPVKMVVTEKI
jgi:hypothetical protein